MGGYQLVQGLFPMNEEVLAYFLEQTFLRFVPTIGGFVVAITIIIILFVMHNWVMEGPTEKK